LGKKKDLHFYSTEIACLQKKCLEFGGMYEVISVPLS